jgi:D-beta-D-heptose 7-phosphate kinase/D-beta-D-heptose 1-phosphate adenosyltransferase
MSLGMQITKTIWTNGCFDILHRGHIELFKYAKSLGNYLVVGIDEDQRVKKSKGDSRPINTVDDRKTILESIRYIDEVVTFSKDSELEKCVMNSEASIMVVGSDYKGKRVIGSQYVDEVKFFNRLDDYSTTKIVENL